jgi:hypothetical protein
VKNSVAKTSEPATPDFIFTAARNISYATGTGYKKK